jgi:transposase InsO family protein
MASTMEATLVLEALNRALGHRQIEADQLLVHTDQGGQPGFKGSSQHPQFEG